MTAQLIDKRLDVNVRADNHVSKPKQRGKAPSSRGLKSGLVKRGKDAPVKRARKRKHPGSSSGGLHGVSWLSGNSSYRDSIFGRLVIVDDLVDDTPVVPELEEAAVPAEKSVRRKRARGAKVSTNKRGADGQARRMSAELATASLGSSSKPNENLGEFKENGAGTEKIDCSTNGTPCTPSRKKRQRKPQMPVGETPVRRESEANSADENQNSSEYYLEEDEESLEENAAMMLSSRFDPRCTGFSAKGVSSSVSVNEVSSQSSSRTSKALGLDMSSVHALRPRKDNGRGFARKRRHFYEVRYSDMDPDWVVKQRIRVFWPLDQSWYFGLVKDYDPVKKQHYIKYDDRDQEWVNLQNERFKLLLFPSEVKSNSEISRSMRKNSEGDKSKGDGNCMGTTKDSETIIPRFGRSKRAAKSSSTRIQEKRNATSLEEPRSSKLSASKGCLSGRTPSLVSDNVYSTLRERLVEEQICQLPNMENKVLSSRMELNFVYTRKRGNKKDNMFDKLTGNTSCVISTRPITFLASVVDGESSVEESNITGTLAKPKQIILKLSLPSLDLHPHSFGAERFLFFNTFLHHQGKLVHLWPEVYVELVFVDNTRGLRCLSFRGCLRSAVHLLCLITSTFYENRQGNKFSEIQAPCTSIGIQLSGLHNRRGRFLFTLCSFVELNSRRWRYLEYKLRQNCMTIGELTIEECTPVNVMTLSSRSNQRFFLSILDYQMSPEFSSKDAGLRNIDADCSVFSTELLSFAATPLFSLRAHLNLLMGNNASALCIEESHSITSQDCQENLEKSAREGCSLVACISDQISVIANENLMKSADGYNSSQLVTRVEDILSDREQRPTHCEVDLLSELNRHFVRSPNTTAPRTSLSRKHGSDHATSGQSSKVWHEGFVPNEFNIFFRKPRTEVSYSSYTQESGSKHRSQYKKERIYKKSKTNITREVLGVPQSSESYLESWTCSANVLVTFGDICRREYGAHVVLDSDNQKDWMLSVKISGSTKYAHKAHQFLQHGPANRYTCAMMWKGEKDWALEFTDRSQWSVFKMMYQECYNRNTRAASFKIIPIPGVRLIDNDDDDIVEVSFVRSSSKYYQQVGTEIDMASDPSHVMYDMDSSDEDCLSNLKDSLVHQSNEVSEVTVDMFERVMYMFEKFAYSRRRDRFNIGEIEEFMADFAPRDIIRAIYEHWQQKLQKKGLPLVRQFQPPMWKHYKKLLKKWELASGKRHRRSYGFQENAAPLLDKPPMFAFCMKPKLLEVPNRKSKQKSHKKFMYMGQRSYSTRDREGRKSNGHSVREDKVVHGVQSPERPYHVLPKKIIIRMPKPDGFLKQQAGGIGLSSRDPLLSSSTENEKSKSVGVHCSGGGGDNYGWTSRPKRPHPDVDEMKSREATSAAQHATKMAKQKRARAEWLMHKADLAVHKARSALMTAEIMETSQGEEA